MEQQELRTKLAPLEDAEYKAFSEKLKVSAHPVLGIRTPVLRSFAKTLEPLPFLESFVTYVNPSYEEVCCAYLSIGRLREKEETIRFLDLLLPLNDGWATNDLLCSSLKQVGKHPEEYWDYLKGKLSSPSDWDKRFSIISLMDWYLKNSYAKEAIALVASAPCSSFYVMLAVAWFLATALITHESEVLPLLEKGKIDEKARKKAIQKAIESYRISDAMKARLRSMR
jgi:3-methyladenine DNA glycosylase AlkD